MTKSRPEPVGSASFCEERSALALTEPAQATIGGDIDRLEEPLRFDLAHARQRFEDRSDLQSGDELLGFGTLEQFGQGERSGFEQLFDLSPDSPGGGGLFQRVRPLLRGVSRGSSHDINVNWRSLGSQGHCVSL